MPALAEACERHERTVYRDLRTLTESGLPCGFDKELNGYRVQPGFFMPPLELTFEEAMAMVALLEQVNDDSQVPFLETAQVVAEKIRSQLPAAILDEVRTLDECVQIDLARGPVDHSARDVYRKTRNAIATKRLLICTYDSVHSANNDADRTFEFRPYALWFCQRAWYAVGHHSGRDDVRRLKLNRFTYVKQTDRPYHIPEDFDLQTFNGNAWRMIPGDRDHDVAIRFTPKFAETASETRWHPTQKEQWHEDGSVTLTFTVSGFKEVCWFVLGYGPEAKVIRPRELAELVRELAERAARQYAV